LAWPTTPPSAADRAAYAEAIVRPFWLDRLPARQPGPPLSELAEADLCIVGGGLTGLWAAIHAKTRQPDRDVILLEGETVGFGASGRNGGFAIASLTHGLENGRARFEDELETIERLARDNFGGMVSDLERLGIDCDLEVTGELTVALEPHQVPWMSEAAELMRAYGHDAEMLDRDAVRSQVASPTYLGGVWDRSDAGLLDPASSPPASPTPPSALAFASTSTRMCAGSPARAPAWRSTARAAPSRRGGRCWRRAPTRRCCARSAGGCCRSTTTR
jgi:glycine/D-amino acid oxidase-like deaminating enzyme